MSVYIYISQEANKAGDRERRTT